MLESLGYAEADAARRRRPDPLQHLLDPREGRRALRRPPRRGHARSSARTPSGVSASAAAGRSRSRTRSSAASRSSTSPSAPARSTGSPSSSPRDSLTAQGYFEFEGFTGHLPEQARARAPGVGADLRRLQLPVLVLHRAVDARPRGLPAARRARRRGPARWPPTACARSRCSARTSTPTGATCGPTAARSPSCCEPSTRSTASTASATRARTPRTCARTSSAPTPSCPRVCEHIHLPLQVGLLADPQGHAPHLRPRALPRPRRADPRARARLRADHRHHRRLPGGDRGGLRRDARGVRGGRLRRRLHVHLLAAPRDDRGRARRRRRRTRSRSSAWSGWSRSCSGGRASARSGSSAAGSRCSSRARRAPTRRACAGARATTRSSTSTAWRRPGELDRGRDRRRDEPDAERDRDPARPHRNLTVCARVRAAVTVGRIENERGARVHDPG